MLLNGCIFEGVLASDVARGVPSGRNWLIMKGTGLWIGLSAPSSLHCFDIVSW